MPAFKIASGDLANTPLLRHVAAFGKPMFVSTGGGTLEDIERAVDTMLPLNEQLCVMQCTASYPCEVEELNLGVIETYRERYPELVVGLSDHHNGIAMAPVALHARRARLREALHAQPRLEGHRSRVLADARRDAAVRPRSPPRPGRARRRREAAARRARSVRSRRWGRSSSRARPAGGARPRAGDLVAKSPADGGLPPYELDGLVGRTLVRPLAFEQAVVADDVEPVEQPVAAREA